MIDTIKELIAWLNHEKVMSKEELEGLRLLNNEIVDCLMYNT